MAKKMHGEHMARMIGHGMACIMLLREACEEIGVARDMRNPMMFSALTAALAIMLQSGVESGVLTEERAVSMQDQLPEDVGDFRTIVFQTLAILYEEHKLPEHVRSFIDEASGLLEWLH